jgi:hypothetical protein
MDASLPHQSSHTLIYADQPAGHKILCAEMQKAVWTINYHIERLPESFQGALMVGYAANVKLTGGYWSVEEKAQKLGISVGALHTRISRAVQALYQRIFILMPCKNSDTKSAVYNTVT